MQLNKADMIPNGKYYVLNGGKTPSGYTNTWNVPSNTITISEGGLSCGYVNYNTEKFYCGGHCYYLTIKVNNVDNKFLFNYLKSIEKRIMRLRVGSGLPNIQKKDIEKVKVILPPLDNQIIIGNYLNSLNKKSKLMKSKINEYLKFKKYLLQNMFI